MRAPEPSEAPCSTEGAQERPIAVSLQIPGLDRRARLLVVDEDDAVADEDLVGLGPVSQPERHQMVTAGADGRQETPLHSAEKH